MRQWLFLWLAQGFGSGRFPFAPGTAGSAVGLLWLFLLLAGGRFWIYLAGVVAGFFASVIVAQQAEEILRQKDPSSVVIDEITAMPLCFLSWIVSVQSGAQIPSIDHFLNSPRWLTVLLLFVTFRLFDVAKPWPIRALQSLPGGWGVTVDDYAAAVYTNLLFLLAVPYMPGPYI